MRGGLLVQTIRARLAPRLVPSIRILPIGVRSYVTIVEPRPSAHWAWGLRYAVYDRVRQYHDGKRSLLFTRSPGTRSFHLRRGGLLGVALLRCHLAVWRELPPSDFVGPGSVLP